MEDRKELIKALKLIHDACERTTGTKCNWTAGDEDGKCPICEILEYCPIDDVPADWTFKKDIEGEIEEHE